MNLQSILEQALAAHREGRLPEAEQGYRRILAAQPRAADVLHLLGMVYYQRGQLGKAEALVRESIALKPPSAECANNFGEILRTQGKMTEAGPWYEKALAQKPDFGIAWSNLGLVREAAGTLAEAMACFEKALSCAEGHAPAWHNLGRMHRISGRPAEAAGCFERAIRFNPNFVEAFSALGITLHELGRTEEALAALAKATALRPDYAEAHYNVGVIRQAQRRFDEAEAAYRRAVALQPNNSDAYNNWGNTLIEQKNYPEALEKLDAAVRLNPAHGQALSNRGICLRLLGRLAEAKSSLEEALRLKPDYAEACNNLGLTLQAAGDLTEAIQCFERCVELLPAYHGGWNNLGLALQEAGHMEAAVAKFTRALELKPDAEETRMNLANAWLMAGEHGRAREQLEEGLRRNPRHNAAHDTYLYLLNCISEITYSEVVAKHREWGRQYALATTGSRAVMAKPAERSGKIRLGFVSADFRYHSVSRFIEPLWEQIDRQRFEIFAYSDVLRPDGGTEKLKLLSDGWRDLCGVPDRDVAVAIRRDQVHVLIDLAGHTAGNRLTVFSHRGAPIQVSYLGYPNITGLPQMDFRLTDALADPPGVTDPQAIEELVRMRQSAWCYAPYQTYPDVASLPMHSCDEVVLGSFNNATKLSTACLDLWAKTLIAVPRARLLLKARVYADGMVQSRVRRELSARGVDPARLTFSPWTKGVHEHLAVYGSVDLALDTYPYHGTTTTCEALWMGVPVVTLAGKTHASRVGVSLLTHAGLLEFIADSADRYVAIVRQWTEDRAALAALRASLRDRMRASVLMDAAAFARDFESTMDALVARGAPRTPAE